MHVRKVPRHAKEMAAGRNWVARCLTRRRPLIIHLTSKAFRRLHIRITIMSGQALHQRSHLLLLTNVEDPYAKLERRVSNNPHRIVNTARTYLNTGSAVSAVAQNVCHEDWHLDIWSHLVL